MPAGADDEHEGRGGRRGRGENTYQRTGSIDARAAEIGAVHPFRPSELPEPLFRHACLAA